METNRRTLEQALTHATLAASKNQDNFAHGEESDSDDPDPVCCWCALTDIQILADEVNRLRAQS